MGIVIPNKWSEQVQDGKLKEPTVFIDPSKDIQAKIAESMVRSFSERVQTVAVSTKIVVTELANSQHSNVEQVAKK